MLFRYRSCLNPTVGWLRECTVFLNQLYLCAASVLLYRVDCSTVIHAVSCGVLHLDNGACGSTGEKIARARVKKCNVFMKQTRARIAAINREYNKRKKFLFPRINNFHMFVANSSCDSIYSSTINLPPVSLEIPKYVSSNRGWNWKLWKFLFNAIGRTGKRSRSRTSSSALAHIVIINVARVENLRHQQQERQQQHHRGRVMLSTTLAAIFLANSMFSRIKPLSNDTVGRAPLCNE